jgi:hypothetical protein
MRLKDLELDAQLEVPREAGSALKALAAGAAGPHQQMVAYRFILDALCGVDRMSFVLADDVPMVMAWREGRRYVGLQLRRIVDAPMSDPEPPPEPPARTMTERHRRRGPNPD